MKNIPAFTVESGVASLILEEIPYKKIAYIKILSSLTPAELLNECVSFCKAVGAEHIYATGHAILEAYPLHTAVIGMEITRNKIPPVTAKALPVNHSELPDWIAEFNERMFSVPNAATMTRQTAERFLAEGSAYYVYDGAEKIGLGVAAGNTLQAILSLIKGRGYDVVCALCERLSGDQVLVEVAANNDKAVRLYHKLGFKEENIISQWHIIC